MSCKQAVSEKLRAPQGYGTVIIGIAGNEITRAVDSATALPVLNSAEMIIKVAKAGGSLITEKIFTESDPKTLSLPLSVGEQI